MGRFKHVNDVERNEDGTLVYTGGHYRIAGDAVERKRTLISFTAGTVMLAVLIILSGCIDADNATKSFTVIIPLIGEVCCLFAICWQAVKVIAGREGVRAYVHEAADKTVPGACRVLSVFALFGLAAALCYLLRSGAGMSAKAVAYLVLKILAAAGAERYGRFWRGLRWEDA